MTDANRILCIEEPPVPLLTPNPEWMRDSTMFSDFNDEIEKVNEVNKQMNEIKRNYLIRRFYDTLSSTEQTLFMDTLRIQMEHARLTRKKNYLTHIDRLKDETKSWAISERSLKMNQTVDELKSIVTFIAHLNHVDLYTNPDVWWSTFFKLCSDVNIKYLLPCFIRNDIISTDRELKSSPFTYQTSFNKLFNCY